MVKIMKKNINLVLGGGGANGIASIGVLLEILSKDYTIKTITGTSAGAIVAGLYSAFVESFPSTIDIAKYLNKMVDVDFEYFKDKDYFNFLSFYGKKLFFQKTTFVNFGLYKGKNLHNQLLENTNYLTFEELNITDLYITACEATTGTLVVFSKDTTPNTKIADAIMASCSIQQVFKPFKIKAREIQGGIFLNNTIKHPFVVNENKNHCITKCIENDELLYLWDGGNMGNTRLDIASQAKGDDPDTIMVGVSYTYENEKNIMTWANALLAQTIKIMMNSSEKLIIKYIKLKNKYKNVILLTPKAKVGTTEFDLSTKKKLDLVNAGIKAVRDSEL